MGDPTDPPERPPAPRRPRRRSLPARLLGTSARGAQRVGEATGISNAVEVATEESIVRAIESEAVERALARVLEGPALEQAVARALESPTVERALTEAIDSEMIDRVWQRLLASDEAQQLVERIAEAPEVRSALASQGIGFVEDIGEEASKVTRRLDDAAESIARRLLFRRRREETTNCAGVATRTLAIVVDAAFLNAIFLVVSALIGFLVSSLGDGDGGSTFAIAIGTSLWLLFGGIYLFSFWALAGQTPGMRFMGISLFADGERRIGGHRAFRRLVGLALAIIPFGIGLLAVLFDERRRGWQDRFAGTEVRFVERRAAPFSAPQAATSEPAISR
jgi:uncharacterized RDD family membrane protein YckC